MQIMRKNRHMCVNYDYYYDERKIIIHYCLTPINTRMYIYWFQTVFYVENNKPRYVMSRPISLSISIHWIAWENSKKKSIFSSVWTMYKTFPAVFFSLPMILSLLISIKFAVIEYWLFYHEKTLPKVVILGGNCFVSVTF